MKNFFSKTIFFVLIATLVIPITFLVIKKFNHNRAEENQTLKSSASKAVIEVFSDFQCPACAAAAPVIRAILEENKDQAELVFNDFPLSYHKWAYKASEAARCAEDQGKFWEYHDLLFQRQREWSETEEAIVLFKQYAADLGLNTEKFNTCLDSGEKAEIVSENLQKGKELNVSATPTFYINGKEIKGYKSWNDFIEMVENELL